jgi:hypothetical protein
LHHVWAEGVLALHAKPGTPRNIVKIYALGVVGGIAAVAKQEHLLISG